MKNSFLLLRVIYKFTLIWRSDCKLAIISEDTILAIILESAEYIFDFDIILRYFHD